MKQSNQLRFPITFEKLTVGVIVLVCLAASFVVYQRFQASRLILPWPEVTLAQRQGTPRLLTVSSDNPRYFADDTGRIVYLTGSHTWGNLQDGGFSDPPMAFDYAEFLDFLEAHNHNFFRLWAWEQTRWDAGRNEGFWIQPLPFARTGPGDALDGKPKYDLETFNEAYFQRLRQRVIEAGDRGMYVAVMLFNGWSVEDKGLGADNPWHGHPFHPSNNINGIDGDVNNDGQGNEVHTLAIPTITAIQEQYVRKVIDTVHDLDNVLFEISNESRGDSEAWQYHLIQLIQEYETDLGKRHPIGMTVEWPDGNNADLFASPADWISPNGELADPPVADGSKVIIADTDHLCGICGDRFWAWKSFTRGQNPIFMDPYDGVNWGLPPGYFPNDPKYVSLRLNLGYTRLYADRIKLAAMRPLPQLASTGYCLANPVQSGAEYLVYLPTGGSVTVDLSAASGELNVEWFNPETGEAITAGTVDGGSERAFTAPFSGDAVLYLYQDAPAPSYQLYVPIVGDGTVSVAPPGPYPDGQVVTLTPIPASGWTFSGWSGDFSGQENPLTVAITADTTITATFTQLQAPTEYTLTLAVEGEGTVLVTPEGPYSAGTAITLTAVASPTWSFTGWTGDEVSGSNPLTFTISSNTLLTATFTLDRPELYTVTRQVNGRGAIALSSDGPFESGEVITLTAQPDTDWRFVVWSGDLVGATNPITYLITGNASVTATFAPIDQVTLYTVTVNVDGEGVVEHSPAGPYLAGQMITLTAVPAVDWHFVAWSGYADNSANPYLLPILQTTEITATFRQARDDQPFMVNLGTQGIGVVTVDPLGPYAEGQLVILTASPAGGWYFVGWGGDVVSDENPLSLTMTKVFSVYAIFVQRELTYLPLVQYPFFKTVR